MVDSISIFITAIIVSLITTLRAKADCVGHSWFWMLCCSVISKTTRGQQHVMQRLLITGKKKAHPDVDQVVYVRAGLCTICRMQD